MRPITLYSVLTHQHTRIGVLSKLCPNFLWVVFGYASAYIAHKRSKVFRTAL